MAENDVDWDAAQEGAELIAEGEIDAAIKELERLVIEQPKNAYGYYYLGAAHFENGDFTKALKAYVTSLEIAPEYLGSMINAGHALRMLGRHQEAIRMAQLVLARAPNDPDSLYLIGVCCFARGEDARAAEFLNKFLHTNPELEVAQEVQGMVQLLMEKHGGAKRDDDRELN